MTYETVAAATQIFAMISFILIFVSVVVFAYWPGNEAKFTVEQRKSLDLDADSKSIGGR